MNGFIDGLDQVRERASQETSQSDFDQKRHMRESQKATVRITWGEPPQLDT